MTRIDSHSQIALHQGEVIDGWGLEAEAHAPAQQQQQSMWALVDDRLRGRWAWMIVCGAVLALVFTVVGYRSTGPVYRSDGTIRIVPRLTPLLTAIDENGQLPFYQSFLVTQMEYIRSRRVLEHALKDEELKALPWAMQPNPLAALEQGLDVVPGHRSELIHIGFEAGDPKVAQTICGAIIRSYDEIYGSLSGSETSQKVLRLQDLRQQYERELRTVRADIQSILARHQTTDLRQLHMTRGQRIEQWEQKLAAAELALERIESRERDDGGSPGEVAGPALAQLESVSPGLAELRRQRDQAVDSFEIIKSRYRRSSPQYANAHQWVQTAERLFQEEYERTLLGFDTFRIETASGEGLEGFYEGLPAARLREEIELLKTRVGEMQRRSEQLIADIQILSDREYEAERIQSYLDRAIARIQGLELESESIASRISVVQEATRPHSPDKDSRKKRAAAGFVFGFCVSFGAFFLLGTIDRRTYGAGQLRANPASHMPRCLGVLPDLGRSLRDSEIGDIASHCVHQIRNQIEVMRDPRRGYALTVSSPFQGDGKTSIVMALGWSYAAAGYSTLLVDCDLVGRALTRQLGMMGRDGVKEALLHRRIDGTITDLPIAHLSAMPVGVDSLFGPETLRQIDLRQLFEQMREQYEIIIIDTGPMLGSLESTPVTAAADGVVLSMRRGRSRTRLEECVRRLESAGARCIGVILNAVGRAECSRYVSDASLAAAEVSRRTEAESDHEDNSVVRAADDERNLLMEAMESSARHGAYPEKEIDSQS